MAMTVHILNYTFCTRYHFQHKIQVTPIVNDAILHKVQSCHFTWNDNETVLLYVHSCH